MKTTKKLPRRLLSLALALVMVLGLLPTVAFAETPPAATYVAKIGETEYTDLATAFAAVKSGETLEILKGGEYTVETLSVLGGATVDATNADGEVIFKHTSAATSWVVSSSETPKTVKKVTFDVGQAHHQYFSNVICENCTIKGLICTHTYNEFKNCTFINEEGYNMWAYGNDVICTDCDFICSGSAGGAINAYNEGEIGPAKLILTGCDFTAQNKSAKYAAVYIKPECTFHIELTDCTANDNFFVGASGSPPVEPERGQGRHHRYR